jgi:hypothetical protein
VLFYWVATIDSILRRLPVGWGWLPSAVPPRHRDWRGRIRDSIVQPGSATVRVIMESSIPICLLGAAVEQTLPDHSRRRVQTKYHLAMMLHYSASKCPLADSNNLLSVYNLIGLNRTCCDLSGTCRNKTRCKRCDTAERRKRPPSPYVCVTAADRSLGSWTPRGFL